MMVKKARIQMDYPGSCISVNHYLGRRKGGGQYVKKECKQWKEGFMWCLKMYHVEDFKLPLIVTCSGYFRHLGVAPDLSNLSKVILDSIQEVSGINDKDMRWHDGERLARYEVPHLIITIQES